MQEWPDDKLDAFFRKLSEEQNPAFESRNWEKLRDRLDQADGKKVFWWQKLLRKGWLITAGAILSLCVLLYLTVSREKESLFRKKESYFSQPQASFPQSQTPVGTQKIPADKLKPAAPAVPSEGVARVSPAEQTRLSAPPGPAPGSPKRRSRQDNKAGGEPVKPAMRDTNRADGTYFLPGTEQPPTVAQVDRLPSGSAVTDRMENSDDEAESLDARTPDRFSAPPLAWLDPLSPRLSLLSEPVLEIKPVEAGHEAEIPAALKNQRRWAVRLAAGPDFSAVKVPDFAAPVPGLAAHIDYQILDHFWIQTGYVRSSKKYTALNGDYTWPAYWTQPVLPESIDATCNMVEIPLNLKYMWGKKSNAAWYVTAGITNYQMQREKYEYNYERPDPQIRRYRWEGSTGWYWLSHAQVSLGYERKLTSRLRIGVEPFVKIPTRKVGFGKVNLYTAGAWLYVSYGR
ncbi:MAG: hypothetical protein ABS46_03195 [Cytophagaceae bacterium SCN 52-12]|nr:MAG: hypothetical protein ABS46_03195 [Cytophagaceae bacterium SCN 52-12]